MWKHVTCMSCSSSCFLRRMLSSSCLSSGLRSSGTEERSTWSAQTKRDNILMHTHTYTETPESLTDMGHYGNTIFEPLQYPPTTHTQAETWWLLATISRQQFGKEEEVITINNNKYSIITFKLLLLFSAALQLKTAIFRWAWKKYKIFSLKYVVI